MTVTAIVRKIMHIPVTLRLQLGDCLSRRFPEISRAQSILHVFVTLSFLWDYLNPGLLKFLVQEFGSVADNDMMSAYMDRLKVFRNSTTIIEYINANDSEENLNCSFYSEVVTKFGREWENKSLEDAENYKIDFCRECDFHFSFFARMSIRRSSIAIVFCFPFSIEAKVNCLEALFIKTKAEQVLVDRTCVFDITGQVRIYKGRQRRGEGMKERSGGVQVEGCRGGRRGVEEGGGGRGVEEGGGGRGVEERGGGRGVEEGGGGRGVEEGGGGRGVEEWGGGRGVEEGGGGRGVEMGVEGGVWRKGVEGGGGGRGVEGGGGGRGVEEGGGGRGVEEGGGGKG